jgi:hypothetical protein
MLIISTIAEHEFTFGMQWMREDLQGENDEQ